MSQYVLPLLLLYILLPFKGGLTQSRESFSSLTAEQRGRLVTIEVLVHDTSLHQLYVEKSCANGTEDGKDMVIKTLIFNALRKNTVDNILTTTTITTTTMPLTTTVNTRDEPTPARKKRSLTRVGDELVRPFMNKILREKRYIKKRNKRDLELNDVVIVDFEPKKQESIEFILFYVLNYDFSVDKIVEVLSLKSFVVEDKLFAKKTNVYAGKPRLKKYNAETTLIVVFSIFFLLILIAVVVLCLKRNATLRKRVPRLEDMSDQYYPKNMVEIQDGDIIPLDNLK